MQGRPYGTGAPVGIGEHTIPGELVGTGPLDAPGTAPPARPAEVQLHPVHHARWQPVGPMPLPALPEKSVGVAFLLTFLFGPFGMFYSTVAGALILLAITVVVSALSALIVGLITLATFGFGAVLAFLAPLAGLPVWITSMIWGCLAASHHNDRVREQYAQHSAAQSYGPAWRA